MIFGHGRHSHFQDSFPLGTVRVLEHMPHHDPPTPADLEACRQWVGDFVRREIQPKLEPAIRRQMPAGSVPERPLLVGTGGTATILGRIEARLEDYDRARLEAAPLTLDTVRAHMQRLWSLPIEERRRIVGLPKKRADVILPGVVVYEAVMAAFGFAELRVSTRGPRFGAVLGKC